MDLDWEWNLYDNFSIVEPSSHIEILQKLNLRNIEKNDNVGEMLKKHIEDFCRTSSSEDMKNLLIASSCLLLRFLQMNWTGPIVSSFLSSQLPLPKVPNACFLSALEADGEMPYPLAVEPGLLLISIEVFAALEDSFTTASLWLARSLYIHQWILPNPVDSLRSKILACHEKMKAIVTLRSQQENSSSLLSRFYSEFASFSLHFYDHIHTTTLIDAFKSAINFDFHITGKMGKRTRFQTFDTPQLVIEAGKISDHGQQAPSGNVSFTSLTSPENVKLDDEVLLENTAFSDQMLKSNLTIYEQIALFLSCLNLQKCRAHDEIIYEEMMPFIDKILERSLNWSVYSATLLTRSRLEAKKARKIERAALQIQALVDQLKLLEPPAGERLKYVFSIYLPPVWDLEKMAAALFKSLGAVRTALETFERLQMWDEVIACCLILQQTSRAEELLLEQIKAQPSNPLFYCIFGDLKNDATYYHKAIEVSEGRYARAYRSLGAYYYANVNFAKSAEFYEKAVALNPLHEDSAFNLGCSYIQLLSWEKAADSFFKVLAINAENSQAWNNLSTIQIQLGRKFEALKSLSEGLKHSFENGRMWENYLTLSVALGQLQESLLALDRLFTINETIDYQALKIVTNAYIQVMDEQNAVIGQRLTNFFERLIEKVNDDGIWELYAKLLISLGEKSIAIECLNKIYRNTQRRDFANEESAFNMAVDAALNLAAAMIDRDEKDDRYQAKLIANGLLRKTSEAFGEHPKYVKLQEFMNEKLTSNSNSNSSSSSSSSNNNNNSCSSSE